MAVGKLNSNYDSSGNTAVKGVDVLLLFQTFYRAMLCAVFAVARCLSICHVGALYPDGWRFSFELLSRPISPRPQAPVSNSKGNPFSGVQNTRSGKILQFSTELAFYLETVRDRPIVAIKY